MSDRSGGNWGHRGALAGIAAVAVLVTACGGGGVPTSASSASSSSSAVISNCLTAVRCYTPGQFRTAYGVEPLLERGIDGRGQTVVLLEVAASAGSPPSVTDVRQDMARFDSVFGLPGAQLQVVNSLARSSSPWLASSEEVMDTEIVHAIAPGAAIREVLVSADFAAEGPPAVSSGLAAALRLGLTKGSVISLSHSYGETCFTAAEVAQLNSALQAAEDHDVTVVNSSGDYGAAANPCPGASAVKGVNLPDSDPLVLAAGGTSLQASRATGAYIAETGWSTPAAQSPNGYALSSGGGFSKVFPRPAYQDGVPGIGAVRGVPDVAADAGITTGMVLAISASSQKYALLGSGGTSAAAPLWAAVIALADQYAGRRLGFVNPAIYRIGLSTAYPQAFHDITTGTNTIQVSSGTIPGYRAGPGWDPVSGWGSPDAQALVPLLARYDSQ